MDDYAGRVLADRYRLPLPPADEYEFVETRAFDTYSGQEVLVRQVPLPEVVDAEVVGESAPYGAARAGHDTYGGGWSGGGPDTRRRPARVDPAVRRAIEAATAAAQVPDHPRLDQVFHVFAEAGSLWIVSEWVPARPLAALLAERPLSPHRAAEVAADVLTALRALHAHGWTHRNITTRTVLVCDDGRAMLTGLAAGAAEEALCGYDPVPEALRAPRPRTPPDDEGPARAEEPRARARESVPARVDTGAMPSPRPGAGADALGADAGTPATTPVVRRGPAGPVYRDQGPAGTAPGAADGSGERPDQPGRATPTRAPRAGAIAAYRAGARAAARGAVENPADAVPEADPATPPGPGTPSGPGVTPDAAARPSPGTEAVGTGEAPTDWWAEDEGRPLWDEDEDFGVRPVGPRDADAAGGASPTGATGAGTATGPRDAGEGYRGPDSALAAQRARQARIVVVGAVTERWAPEQAGPVYENWRLAPPVGPAADLWAVGVLLFRAVQGHAPYPEDSAAELVDMVCAEPPAYAEECGALRPVVESLMRQDPTERPDFEELRGWLRSLVRSAPEPDVGSRTVTVPPVGIDGPADPKRLPILRRRGELVRRRRQTSTLHGRHRHKKGRPPRVPRQREAPPGSAHRQEKHLRMEAHESAPQRSREPGARPPRHLGRLLLALILLLLAGGVLYAMLFMPKAEQDDGADRGSGAAHSGAPATGTNGGKNGDAPPVGQQPQSADPTGLAKGFELRKDPDGFQVAVASGWERRPPNGRGQIRYLGADYELIVVPGRDKTAEYGGDPMRYQQNLEPELAPYRDSDWASATGLRRIDVGQTAMAEGAFGWKDSSGRQVYVRNLAMIISGRYHVVQIVGPADERAAVDRYFDQAAATYRATR
ncbi:protein kinase [Streptomyces sp. NPDC057702]|uniref:protein kinase n=1 Tax=unclassified Streptomyces TaxID=2593676 RepID=UPI0036BC64BE